MTTAGPALAGFNALPAAEAERELRSCCASAGWARQVAAGRPYPDLAAVCEAAVAAVAELGWPDIAEALAAHPRIGEPPAGAGREAGWSRREQAGIGPESAPAVVAALAEANREYERRFGHVFLVFAAGRTDTELLAAARQRLGNPPEVERELVRTELGRIARLRLERLLG